MHMYTYSSANMLPRSRTKHPCAGFRNLRDDYTRSVVAIWKTCASDCGARAVP